MKKYLYLLCILIIAILLVSCKKTNEQLEVNSIESDKDIIEKRYVQEIVELKKHIEELEKSNSELESGINIVRKEKIKVVEAFREENSELQNEINNLISEKLENNDRSNHLIEVSKHLYRDEGGFIDGGVMLIDEDRYYLKYKDEKFISTNLIKELFGIVHDYGIVVKGFPYEDYIIKNDGKVKVSDIVDKIGIAEEFNKQVKQGNYDYIIKEVEGLKIYYGEVGVSKYTFTDSTYMTERGILIGSSREDVKKAYGQLGSNADEKWYTFICNAEYSQGDNFEFAFDENDIVIEISYG